MQIKSHSFVEMTLRMNSYETKEKQDGQFFLNAHEKQKRRSSIIQITGSIIVMNDIKTVFNFISDIRNDKAWRSEINYTAILGEPKLSVRAFESSYLSKRYPEHILSLECGEYLADKYVVYQTLSGAEFFLKSTREVKYLNPFETRIVYSVEFDKAIVKKGLGFNLPTFFVRMVAKSDMKKYLNTLFILLKSF